MTAALVRAFSLAALALTTTACARSESAQGASDTLGKAIAQQDSAQEAATVRREAGAREAVERGRVAAVRDLRRAEAEEARRTSAN